ncbi:threonine aldolase family protein [Aeoliella mucimassa]|uniref:L-allo-threonine aldolase n=1 Tax=Aeoliella mucimassa TaxID=2527972 RepID=A0A518ALK1_9BACT|nr:GntG family PLP-dependent aldolase [Aeoliella mucimassa]QDU55607.1 L-allo-threonine aldolase [Aeoliella mucimassa]
MIDLRSDTVTKPTPAMREAMAQAEVGDDVMVEDPTVNALEQQVAELLGKPAALFVPSGTMGNQLGVRVHCRPGDEFLCEAQCHIYHYEQGAYAQLFGVATQPVVTPSGLPTIEQLAPRVRGSDLHHPRTKLLCLENTHNRHGGVVLDYQGVAEVCQWAAEAGLARHLDGARLWNAVVASGRSAAEWARHFDTVSVCFSKGLGAPVGSALVGPTELIAEARRTRKALGGGMRQCGILAAAAMHALEHHLPRLAEDHDKADVLRTAIDTAPHLEIERPGPQLTNLLFFQVKPSWGTAAEFVARAREQGVAMFDLDPHRVRAVVHRDVSMEQVQEAGAILQQIAEQGPLNG